MSRMALWVILGIAVFAIVILAAVLEPGLVAALLLVAWLAGWLDRVL